MWNRLFRRSLACCMLWLAISAAASAEEKLPLWPGKAPVGDGSSDANIPQITIHRPPADKANGAAMIICPGGGYRALMSQPEGHGIAAWLVKHGITGIVLEYRLPAGRKMVPLLDAQRAIRTARYHAKDWHLNPQRIGIIGFSAGGHLASTADTHFDAGNSQAADPIDRVSCRPDFAVLVYPVITMGEKGHAGSRQNLLGREPAREALEQFSNEKQVTDQTPPTFLAHPLNDTVVPPENSREFYAALQRHHVPSEYLELPEGGHGLNGYKGPMWDAWQAASLRWLASLGFIPATDATQP